MQKIRSKNERIFPSRAACSTYHCVKRNITAQRAIFPRTGVLDGPHINTTDYMILQNLYIADAIDTISAKIELICRAKAADVSIISAMGAGNKLDPSAFRIADLSKTQVCPLAKIMRRELGARGIKHLCVVYSEEKPQPSRLPAEYGKHVPASLSFVPSAMGLIMAGKIVCDLTDTHAQF